MYDNPEPKYEKCKHNEAYEVEKQKDKFYITRYCSECGEEFGTAVIEEYDIEQLFFKRIK